MTNKLNSTDLHIAYKLETAEVHHYYEQDKGNAFHYAESYTFDYTRWLEEKYLKFYNDAVESATLLEYVEEELERLAEDFNDLEEENYELQQEIEALHEQNAGPSL